MRTLVAAMIVMATSSAAWAGSEAGGVGVVIAGEPAMQPHVARQVEGWLEQHGYAYVAAPFDRDATKTFLNCFVVEDVTCARGTFEQRSKAGSLVFVRVELVGGDAHEVSLTGNWFVRDKDVFAEKRWCKHCDDAALRGTVDQLMTFLAASTGLGKGSVEIHSRPEGAVVAIDGKAVGAAPVTKDVAPGPHEISLQRDGVTMNSKLVKIEPGASVEVSLAVVEVAARRAPPPPPPPWNAGMKWAVALVAGGAAAAIPAGIFFYYGHKGGPDTPLVYPDATRDGVIFTVAGVASITAGVLLWRYATKGRNVSMAIGPGGGTIGWAGHF
ncbi:MAG: PEGA domain-containing protein [Acidobacteriota bacterium]